MREALLSPVIVHFNPLHGLSPKEHYEAALAVIAPAHPRGPAFELRIGVTPRGSYQRFERRRGLTGHDSWSMLDDKVTEADLDIIFALYGQCKEECKLEHRRGPSGAEMLYHIDEGRE